MALAIVLIAMLDVALEVQRVEAGAFIRITPEGLVEGTTKIEVEGYVYTFTGNIAADLIQVEKASIIIDGAGYTLDVTGGGMGFYLLGVGGVIIRNVTIDGNGAENGILSEGRPYNKFLGNTIKDCMTGIWLGAWNHTVSGNVIEDNDVGIGLYMVWNSTISGNTMENNDVGMEVSGKGDNKFYHNNFIDNTNQVDVTNIIYPNTWDDGYPCGGNYWSDHEFVDEFSGPDQDVPGPDGICDTQYEINADNIDRYPLMGTSSEFPVTHGEETYDIPCTSNSTVSAFEFDPVDNVVRLNVTGPDGTGGFCRICIPRDLMEPPYTVIIDDGQTEVLSYNEYSLGNVTCICFTYQHSKHQVEIIPEFPTWASMLLMFIVLTVATAIYRRRLPKTHARMVHS